MSLVMATSVGGARLIFAADSKIRYRDPDDSVQSCVGSKVTVFPTRRGNLVIGFTGMWVEGGADELLHGVIRGWAATDEPLSHLCDVLAEDVAQRLTVLSVEADMPNLSEFLVGLFPTNSKPSLWFVSSGHSGPIADGIVRAIGGDPTYAFTQTYRPEPGVDPDARFVLRAFERALTQAPSEAYDYPVLLLELSGASEHEVSRDYYGPGLDRVTAPAIQKQSPRPFDASSPPS
jgi:hypothetical protein